MSAAKCLAKESDWFTIAISTDVKSAESLLSHCWFQLWLVEPSCLAAMNTSQLSCFFSLGQRGARNSDVVASHEPSRPGGPTSSNAACKVSEAQAEGKFSLLTKESRKFGNQQTRKQDSSKIQARFKQAKKLKKQGE